MWGTYKVLGNRSGAVAFSFGSLYTKRAIGVSITFFEIIKVESICVPRVCGGDSEKADCFTASLYGWRFFVFIRQNKLKFLFKGMYKLKTRWYYNSC